MKQIVTITMQFEMPLDSNEEEQIKEYIQETFEPEYLRFHYEDIEE
jgi:hypothetical protein